MRENRRDWRIDLLRGILRRAEDDLERRGKPRGTWRELRVTLGPLGITVAGGDDVGVLGPRWRTIRKATASPQESSAWRAILRAARTRQKVAAGLSDADALALVCRENPTLYRRYLSQTRKTGEARETTAPWRAAKRAAVAAALLDRLDDPVTAFWAAMWLERALLEERFPELRREGAAAAVELHRADIDRGKAQLKGASTGGKVRVALHFKPKWEEWQREASAIAKQNPHLSLTRVAELVGKRTGGKTETIRKHIKISG